MKYKIGVVGLGVMGQNLALNVEEKGFPAAVYDRSPEVVDEYTGRNGGKNLVGCKTLRELVGALETPRLILIMIKAGQPVDDTIALLKPLLEKGDTLIDGGNEYFRNTERRSQELEAAGLNFVGMGVSGGEEGARKGPSLMPGGQRAAYDRLEPILTKIAAQVDDGPCVDYMGPGAAGHYVKMVHNGIEYGDMQLIAETYDILKNLGGLDNNELADTFSEWNNSELQSFLIEITSTIFRKADDRKPEGSLVDQVVDATGMKGTGKWTVQEAAELSAPIPTIASSVEARILAAKRAERIAAARRLGGPEPRPANLNKSKLVADVKNALYAAKICSYAQGMNLLKTASANYGWNLQLGRIARIWKGGCIIRAQFLDRIKQAYDRAPDVEGPKSLANLLLDAEFSREMSERQPSWRRVLQLGIENGLPMPTLGASLSYYDSYRRDRLPANLTQAQRDLFGAHTYERIDQPGHFHSDWNK